MVSLPYNKSMLFPTYTTTAKISLFSLMEQREQADENTKPRIDLAFNLICLRQDRKQSQKDVADALGVNQKNVSQWERGEVVPSLRYLIALAKYHSVTIDRLLEPCKA